MADELHVYLGGARVGRLTRLRSGRIELDYDSEWQSRRDAYPVSISLPLAARHHGAAAVEPYLWGLLPDSESIVERWARRFQVSARNAFALLAHVGADCPGAVRILRPDVKPTQRGNLDWLAEADVAARLRELRADTSAWRAATDSGQFSLAGAQPKTALWFDGTRWGLPSGTTPTTHILKPGILDLDGSAHNEHYCLTLARELGLPAAGSEIRLFEDETAIVVERYDRKFTAEGAVRVHQEDMCQALSVHPSKKYQNEGGPGARDIVALLQEVSAEPIQDVATFVSALVFNWLIAGTDAHAKNYSLLIAPGARCRLAPLYDLASALPYPDLPFQKLKLAMKLGGKYRVRDIGRHQWAKLANEVSLDSDLVDALARDMAQRLPDASSAVLARVQAEGVSHSVVSRLHTELADRGARVAAQWEP